MVDFNIPFNDFLNVNQNSRQQCGMIDSVDTNGRTYCLASVTDLSHRLLHGVGIRVPRGESKNTFVSGKEMIISLSDENEPVIFSEPELKNKIKQTKRFVCNPWARGLGKSTKRDIRDYSHKRFGQCLRGIKLMESQFEAYKG